MDDALDALSSLTSKKRVTTYKKVANPIPDEDDNTEKNLLSSSMDGPPTLTGNGFLFGNATLNRVKNRLEGKKVPEQDNQSENNGKDNALTTQLITNLYDGGEELEETKSNTNDNNRKDRPAVFTQTQKIPINIQPDNVVNVPIHSVNEERPTQIFKNHDSITTNSQTQEIPLSTTRQTQAATQRIDNQNTTSQTQQVPLTGPIEPQTQVIAANNYDSDAPLLGFSLLTTRTSPLFQTVRGHDPATQMNTPPQTALDKDNTQIDTMPQTANGEGKTQMDSVPQTMQDDVPHTLKIHGLQKELAIEDSKMERARNVEYKVPKKTIPIKINFSKESFLANFDNSSSDEDTDAKLENSQPKQQLNEDEIHENNQSEPDLTDEAKKSDKSVPLLSSYVNNLKREIDSSKCITLDLDSDSDDGNNDHIGDDKLIKDEGTLPISQLSKATILNLKARLSKQNKKLTQRSKKHKDAKIDHNKLFNTLRKASRKQILDHQKELIETKGFKMEDMVKEKEIVENLLEQEILRNKKIRQREKRKEKLGNNDFEVNSEDSGSDSESGSPKFPLSENEITDYSLSGSENENFEDANGEEEEEEEDIITKKKKSVHVKHIVNESDSEVEVEQKVKVDKKMENTPKRNAIDLGHYGDNIDEETGNSFQEAAVLDTQQVEEITIEKKMIENKEEEEEVEKNDDNNNAEVDEAVRRELIDKERLKSRKKEKEQAAKLKELKSMGVTNFFEMEAEESEDEWHGIGGADGEGSDEYDSDVEKMIDDYSKSNFNSHEIREMLAAENKEMDLEMINRILYDIKNGGFRNKRAKNSLELELSDDEDDVLQQYRLKRRELMRKRRLEIGNDTKLVKNPKSKAFFESMVEDIMEFKNPFKAEEESNQDVTSTTTDLDTQENDSVNFGDNTGHDEHKHINDKNKKIIISEDFVQKSLSFLKSNNYDEFEMDKELARIQHGNGNGEEEIEDLFTLKQHSSIKSFTNSQTNSFSSRTFNTMIDLEKHIEEDGDVENGDRSLIGGFKHPSVIKSFASRTDINDKFKEGNKTVKISKSYKTVKSSKASITYMGKTRKLMAPKRKAVGDSHHHNKKSRAQKSKLFESGHDSFDS